jgi:hypothetical protein
MDANTPEILVSTAVFTNATGVKLVLPLAENITVVEFGAYNGPGADNVAAAVLKLQGVDTTAGGATYTDLLSCTHTSALVQGSFQGRRCDVSVEKDATVLNSTVLTNRAIANGTQILPSVGKQFVAIQLNVTTAYTASVAPYFYIKFRKQGTGGTAITGESLVTS